MRRERLRPMHFSVHRLHDGTVLAAYPIRKPSKQELKRDHVRIDPDGVAREFADGGRNLSDVHNETRTRFQDIIAANMNTRRAIRELVDSYNDAVMRFDGEAWASNWRDDATWSLPGAGPIKGKENFFPMWQGAMEAFSFAGFFASAGPIGETWKEAP